MKMLINKVFAKFGLKVVAKTTLERPYDLEKEFYDVREKCKGYTMTSTERLYSLYKSINYITENKIEGDIVECGVWKGGSSMMAALSLIKSGDTSRTIYMYDTYKGMSVPTEKDVSYQGITADKEWK